MERTQLSSHTTHGFIFSYFYGEAILIFPQVNKNVVAK